MLPPDALVAHLKGQSLVEADARFETLYGGRTNQVWKVLGGAKDTVLKLYNAAFKNPLFRNDPALEASTLRALKNSGFVPNLRAEGQFADVNWVIYDHAPGEPWRSGTADVARLLRKLHSSGVNLDAPKGANGSAELGRHTQEILAGCRSDLRNLLRNAQPQTHIPPANKRCLIHGDPVAGNILRSAAGLTLIDWQCPASGDPCEDLAIFLSPAMHHLYRGTPLTAVEEREFLEAYDRPEITERYELLRPWYAWRMAAYCLWRFENGAPDYAKGFELELGTLQSL